LHDGDSEPKAGRVNVHADSRALVRDLDDELLAGLADAEAHLAAGVAVCMNDHVPRGLGDAERDIGEELIIGVAVALGEVDCRRPRLAHRSRDGRKLSVEHTRWFGVIHPGGLPLSWTRQTAVAKVRSFGGEDARLTQSAIATPIRDQKGPRFMTRTPRSDVIIQDLEGDRWLVTLQGEHDASTAPALRKQVETIYRTGTSVIIDLSPTSFIDSSILAVLLSAKQRADTSDEKRFGLVVSERTPPDRLLRLAGAMRLFDVYQTVEEALAEFDDDDAESLARWKHRTQRIIKNEQAFRDYNNRRLQVEDIAPTDDSELIPFVCECGDSDCIEALSVTAAEFVQAHAAPNLFLVKPGHVYPDVEKVIVEQPTYAIVAKHAAAVRAADVNR
jgi:anti-sigma B factor antagonist